MERNQIRPKIHDLYAREHAELGAAGTLRQLEEAQQWPLAPTLAAGGVVVFPHAGVLDCGHQIAAAVLAALDSGADRVLVISVLHAFTDAMQEARVRVAEGEAPSHFPTWGIQGPGLERGDEWRSDHALTSWRHFWKAETERRGIAGTTREPEVIERYPYLAGGKPEALPGFDEIAKLAEEAVIVSTADPFHHGIGYGDGPGVALAPEAGGLELARERINDGIELLAAGDYWGYNGHCVDAKSDARDAGQLFRYLRGPMSGKILDLAYTDTTEMYAAPPPTWVAGALVEWKLAA